MKYIDVSRVIINANSIRNEQCHTVVELKLAIFPCYWVALYLPPICIIRTKAQADTKQSVF